MTSLQLSGSREQGAGDKGDKGGQGGTRKTREDKGTRGTRGQGRQRKTRGQGDKGTRKTRGEERVAELGRTIAALLHHTPHPTPHTLFTAGSTSHHPLVTLYCQPPITNCLLPLMTNLSKERGERATILSF
ncbi:MAG: hypothetical protein CLLPBCKN_003843 [Chroococcidiopsis cubana SAG 39.79]|uniref:hypothetical protein n=1 Tax=Chroococcidiopsis cubana TaxID=171392 RepID=UPI002AC742D9|nr:hypothetical protein [Chroococcidiopsis cubana]MDZ4874447.1 hypothetical protein [Chroococcidiopsis cubana SAG 39.79]